MASCCKNSLLWRLTGSTRWQLCEERRRTICR